MSEWKEYILEEVIEKFIDYRGKTPTKTEFGIPLLTAKIVKSGRLLEPNEFIAQEDYTTWMNRGYPEKDDVVLTTEAPLGEVALVKDKNVALGQRLITLHTKKELCNSIYLMYYLQSSEGQASLQARSSGSTVEGIKSTLLKKMEIVLPSISDQQSIASVLSCLDDKIDLLTRENKTLEAMAEILFRQWFSDVVDENYTFTTLSSILSIKHGYAFSGNEISVEPSPFVLVTPGNFKVGGGFKNSKYKYFSGIKYPADYVFSENDLIVTMTDLSVNTDTLGYPAFVPECTGVKFLHNQRVGKVVFNEGYENWKYFIYFVFKTEEYRSYILGTASGTSIMHTSPDRICGYQTSLPENKLINDLNLKIIPLFDKMNNNHRQINSLERTRNSLLQKLFSGEVKVGMEV